MRRVLIAAFTIGWLLPMWAAGSTVLEFLEVEAWPLWRGDRPANSFPFLRFASQAFTIGAVWLAAVMAWWAWRLAGLQEAPPRKNKSTDAIDSR